MGKRQASIEVLLKRCEADLAKIDREYTDSLHVRQVRPELQVDIKNFCENLGSVLDYLAHDIRERYCPAADPAARFYFPIMDDPKAFEGQVKKWYPDLDTAAPELWKYLQAIQPYQSGFAWLAAFNKLNNENKHGNLVPQTRTEMEQVRVSTPGVGTVTWTPQNVRFGPGVSIGGVPVDHRTQMPVPHPSQTVERITWVDFRFQGENISALGLLKQALAGVQRIATETQQWT